MADDFDVEAMLEAPYRKVGLALLHSGPVSPFIFFCFLSPCVIATVTKFSCYCDSFLE